MEESGRLKHGDLPGLLQKIAGEELSGLLELCVNNANALQTHVHIFFESGKINACVTENDPPHLADELIQEDLLSVSQIQDLLARSREHDKRLEEVLSESGLLTSEKIRDIYGKILATRLRKINDARNLDYIFKRRANDAGLGMSVLGLSNEELFLKEGMSIQALAGHFEHVGWGEVPPGFAEPTDPLALFLASDKQPNLATPPVEYVDLPGDLGLSHENTPTPPPEDLGFLNAMLRELNQMDSAADTTVLVMRYASQVFGRSVLLRVEDPYVHVVAAFGFENHMPHLQFKRAKNGFFSQLLKSQEARKASWSHLATDEADQAFFDLLKPQPPQDFLAVPIVCRGQLSAVLYGDAGEGSELSANTVGLEIFLGQVGVALEKSFLTESIARLKNQHA